jgi:hypothetical protein
MLLGGLWHGARWTFVAWGALHGLYLVGQRLLGRGLPRVPAVLQVLVVFHLTCFAWIFFRSPSFHVAWQYLSGIAHYHGSLLDIDNRWRILKCLLLIAGLLSFEFASFFSKREFTPALRLAFCATCVWIILIFGTFSGLNFIYFQF